MARNCPHLDNILQTSPAELCTLKKVCSSGLSLLSLLLMKRITSFNKKHHIDNWILVVESNIQSIIVYKLMKRKLNVVNAKINKN